MAAQEIEQMIHAAFDAALERQPGETVRATPEDRGVVVLLDINRKNVDDHCDPAGVGLS
jgi:hypothetical protein